MKDKNKQQKNLKGKKEYKLLDDKFDYYNIVKKKSDELYYKYNLSRFIGIYNKDFNTGIIDEDMAKELFYNLNLNICNQVVYEYNYEYTKDDLFFISDFQIDKIFKDIVSTFLSVVIRMKEIEDKAKLLESKNKKTK
ncbi:MAG: hypothetical protein RSE00_03460 [Clostridia bacterium]